MGTLSIMCTLSLIIASISTLPISIEKVERIEIPQVLVQENAYVAETASETSKNVKSDTKNVITEVVSNEELKVANVSFRNTVRPGMRVISYDIEITPNVNDRNFEGRLQAIVQLTDTSPESRDEPLIFNVEDLNIRSVQYAQGGSNNYLDRNFHINDDGNLQIDTVGASTYSVIIEYQGTMGIDVRGMFTDRDGSYIGMHLTPIYARRVFPCIDELIVEPSRIRFGFVDVPFNRISINSAMENETHPNIFRTLNGPPHRWGMIAHNLNPSSIVQNSVRVYARPGIGNRDGFATAAINVYFPFLQVWTGRPYFDIFVDQNPELSLIALPDTSVDWIGLSTVAIWEPYLIMENNHSMKQRMKAMIEIAEGFARQWYGYVLYPEDWKYNWIITGLETFSAYEAAKIFESNDLNQTDIIYLDVDTLFVTEVIQKSLYYDGYTNTQPLQPDEDIIEYPEIRDHVVNGFGKLKAAALLRMLDIIFGGTDREYMQRSASALLRTRAHDTVNVVQFVDAFNGAVLGDDDRREDIENYLNDWTTQEGYPTINVTLRDGGAFVTQDHFSFSTTKAISFDIPLTYTTSRELNFNDDMIYEVTMAGDAVSINADVLDGENDDEEGDFILFNIRGQGYYRVNYQEKMWMRIINRLEDPEQREMIHPLNRATLIDDSLNLARGNRLRYDIALSVALTMEHETEYAPWKAFIRNMEFIKRRLEFLVSNDEDLDQTIYQRLLRRTMVAFENEIGFSPLTDVTENVMTSLTRGLVMEHACKAGYEPCIAAAVDWFYNPSDSETVNPNIPPEIRPAVYCAMVREAGEEAISALNARLDIEDNAYERVVIIRSFACAQDTAFIQNQLIETVSTSTWGTEERMEFFEAVVESGLENAIVAYNFLLFRSNDLRENYGGDERLERIIYHVGEYLHADVANNFRLSVGNFGDSEGAGERARDIITENENWEGRSLQDVYDWLDENDASSIFVSLTLLFASVFINLFNNNIVTVF